MGGRLGLGLLACCMVACSADETDVRGYGPVGAAGSAGSGGVTPSEDGLPGANLFRADAVLEVRLSIAAADLEQLEEHGDLEQYVPARVRLGGTALAAVELAEVGVRHKGSYTLHHCWDDFGGVRSYVGECAKLSLKLKFDEYDPDQRFDGLKRLNLHASTADPSKLHELLGYQAFRDFGVDAPRTLPARVYVNDELQGLFIAVEEVDGRYTAAHFPDAADGNLYKEVWPSLLASDVEFLAAMETNEASADVSDLRAFADAVARSTPETFEAELAPFVDVEALLRYVAVDRAIRNWDGIMAFYAPQSPHNFFWYHDDGPSPRFHLIPWDLDGTFWPFDPYMHPQQWVTAAPIPDFNARPLNCDPRPIWDALGPERVTPPRCDRLLDSLALRHWPRLVEIGQELIDGPLAPARLTAQADAWAARLAPLIADDPVSDPGEWQRAVAEVRDIVGRSATDLRAFLDQGLIEEVEVSTPSEPTPENIDQPSLDSGLHVGTPTNFEFAAPPEGEPAGVFTYGDPLSSFGAVWSSDEPISGAADLRFDFTFNRGPGVYDEWVGVGLGAPESDVRGYSALVVWLSTDIPRNVRVRLSSPVYEELYGGILIEFGADVSVGVAARAIVIPLLDIYYPPWAKEDWSEGQGFAGTEAEALQQVLARLDGIIFGPSPTLNASGELTAASETGFLRIDNIYFR